MTSREPLKPMPPSCPQYDDDEISLLDLLLVLARRKKLIFFITLFFALGGFVFNVLRTPPTPSSVREEKAPELSTPPRTVFKASVRFLAPVSRSVTLSGENVRTEKTSPDTPLLWQTGDDVALKYEKKASILPLLWKSIVTGPHIKERMLMRFAPEMMPLFPKDVENGNISAFSDDLQGTHTATAPLQPESSARAEVENSAATIEKKLLNDALASILGIPSLQPENDSYRLIVEHTDHSRVRELANAYIQELEKILNEQFACEASAARLQVENELKLARQNLLTAEEALKKHADSRETSSSSGDTMVLQENSLPDFTYVRLRREWSFYQSLHNMLLWNYEAARMNETHGRVEIPVLEAATAPQPSAPLDVIETPSEPKKDAPPPPKSRRSLVVVLGGFLGFFLSVFMAFMAEFWKKASEDPEQSEKVRELRESLGITKLFSREKKPPKKR